MQTTSISNFNAKLSNPESRDTPHPLTKGTASNSCKDN